MTTKLETRVEVADYRYYYCEMSYADYEIWKLMVEAGTADSSTYQISTKR